MCYLKMRSDDSTRSPSDAAGILQATGSMSVEHVRTTHRSIRTYYVLHGGLKIEKS